MPEQEGVAVEVGPVMVNALLHELSTTGGVGVTKASLTQGTVEPPFGGIVNVGGGLSIVA